jgi:hypothetical protein
MQIQMQEEKKVSPIVLEDSNRRRYGSDTFAIPNTTVNEEEGARMPSGLRADG